MSESRWYFAAIFSFVIASAGCTKKHESEDAAASPSSAATTTPAASTNDTAEADEDRKKKQALLDYATMEDQYINDAAGQWASSARASSFFGQSSGSTSDQSKAENAIGKPDGGTWSNDNQDMGFDWLEASFDKPVHARAVRFVFLGELGVEAVNKVELLDDQGGWHTAWSGLSDVKGDNRGRRTWFVRQFEKTPYKVKAAKITIANAVQSGYKNIDAVQLVGEES